MEISADNIEIVSAENRASIAINDIIDTLASDEMALSHGDEFTGRPTTTVIASEHYVIKLRTEYSLDDLNGRMFCRQAMEKEAQVGFYHPLKTWFLFREQLDGPPVIANITPKLCALHESSLFETVSHDQFLTYLITIFQRALKIAAQHDILLDLGLSNFGLDKEGEVYYVDDDTYRWDNFQMLSQFLGILLRANGWMSEQHCTTLGEKLREIVITEFNDPHWCTVIAQEMKSIFVPEGQQSLFACLREGLQAGKGYTHKPSQEGNVIALIADIHGNAPALESTLEFLQQREIDSILMLGDVVGYGPHPKQCIEMLKGLDKLSMIRGNHDNAAANQAEATNMNEVARWSLEWTRSQLDESDRQWLSDLPPYLEGDEWLAVHGAPVDKSFFNAYVYKLTCIDNLDELEERKIRYCFHGHTHVPYVYYRSALGDNDSDEPNQSTEKYTQALICPGSIGQPRNRQPGAHFALIDLDRQALEMQRISYDMRSVVTDMKQREFPEKLVSRLLKGE